MSKDNFGFIPEEESISPVQENNDFGFQPDDAPSFQLSPKDKSTLSKFVKEKPVEVPAMSSFTAGTAQGVTLGGADELEAAIKAGLDSGKTYEQVIEDVRKQYKTKQTANPVPYFAGEIVGGIMNPIGGVAKASKGIAGALKRIGVGIGEGTTAGALTSDADVKKAISGDKKEQEKLKTDLAFGGGLGGLGSTGGELLGAGFEFIKGSKLGKKFTEGRKLGLEGINLGKDEDKAKIARETLERLDKLAQSIDMDIEGTIKQQTKALEKSGAKLDLNDFLNNLEKELKQRVGTDPKDIKSLESMLTTIDNFKKGVTRDTGVVIPGKTSIIPDGPEEVIVKAKKGSREKLQEEAERKVLAAKDQGLDLEYNIKEIKDSDGKPNLLLSYTKREVPEATEEVGPKIIGKTYDGSDPKAADKLRNTIADMQSKADFDGRPVTYKADYDEVNNRYRIIEEPTSGVSPGMSLDTTNKVVPDLPSQPEVRMSPIKVDKTPDEPLMEVIRPPVNPSEVPIQEAMNLRRTLGNQSYNDELFSKNLNPVVQRNTAKLSKEISNADPVVGEITKKLDKYYKTFENLGIDPREDKAWLKFSNLIDNLTRSGSMSEAQSQKLLTDFLEDFNKIDSPIKSYLKPEIDDIFNRFAISSAAGKEGLGGGLSRLGYTVGGVPAVAGSMLGMAEKKIKDATIQSIPGDSPLTVAGKEGLNTLLEGASAIGSRLNQGKLSTNIGATAKTILNEDVNKSKGETYKSISPSADLSKKLYDLPKEDYETVASIIEQNPELRTYADGLRKAQQTNNRYQSNAIMFSLAQNPKARKLLGIGQDK